SPVVRVLPCSFMIVLPVSPHAFCLLWSPPLENRNLNVWFRSKWLLSRTHLEWTLIDFQPVDVWLGSFTRKVEESLPDYYANACEFARFLGPAIFGSHPRRFYPHCSPTKELPNRDQGRI